MIELPRFLPNEQNVDPVIDADREHEAERQNVEQVQRQLEQFHRRDHGADRHHERRGLDEPEAPIAVKQGEQRRIEERHQSADQNQLAMRPRHEIREGETPP